MEGTGTGRLGVSGTLGVARLILLLKMRWAFVGGAKISGFLPFQVGGSVQQLLDSAGQTASLYNS